MKFVLQFKTMDTKNIIGMESERLEGGGGNTITGNNKNLIRIRKRHRNKIKTRFRDCVRLAGITTMERQSPIRHAPFKMSSNIWSTLSRSPGWEHRDDLPSPPAYISEEHQFQVIGHLLVAGRGAGFTWNPIIAESISNYVIIYLIMADARQQKNLSTEINTRKN